MERVIRHRENSQRFYWKRRVWLDEIKLKSGCVDCGFNLHPAALEFDHVRGKKLFVIGQNVSRSKKSLLLEMSKCDIVCANCHAIRTAERRK